MTKTQKKYSKTFKMETLELARTSSKSDSQLERELGLGLRIFVHLAQTSGTR